MATGVLRWGICCASKIGFDFCAAVQLLPATEHDIVAVAARDQGKAQEFADKLKIPNAYGSYQELAKDENVGECSGLVSAVIFCCHRFVV